MISSPFGLHAVAATVLAGLLVLPATASAQNLYAGLPAEQTPQQELVRDRVRVAFRADFVSRNYTLDNEDGSISFDAPMYPGARLALDLFPVAVFARDSPAAGLGVQIEFGKHDVSTVTDIVESGQEPVALDIPTRHDTSWYALVYEWSVSPKIVLLPHVGWRTLEYALSYNPLYQNTFYQGVEIGAGLRYRVASGLDLTAAVGIRPAVSLGSTATVWGESASAFGLNIDAGVRYRTDFGLFFDGGLRYENYSTDYTPGPEDLTRTTASDGFFSILLAFGYAY